MNNSQSSRDHPDMPARIRQTGIRNGISGELSDDHGAGQFELVRLDQAGFSRVVDFVPAESGIAAINYFEPEDFDDRVFEDEVPVAKSSLAYRFSVDPAAECAVKFSHVSLSKWPANGETTLTLTWQGDGLAVLEDSGAKFQSQKNGAVIEQGEVVKLPKDCDCAWRILVPSNAISVTIETEPVAVDPQDSEVSLLVDVAYAVDYGSDKISPAAVPKTRPGRIQPKEVMEIINHAEATGGIRPGIGNLDSLQEPASLSEKIPVFDETSSGNLKSIGSQKVDVLSGEDVILGTSGLFENHMVDAASFVSMNMPEWLFLDQMNGDIMGTVPLNIADEPLVHFTVYAVDGQGNSAKATIAIECFDAEKIAVPELRDQEVSEGIQVLIETAIMFVEAGLDVRNHDFSATGLPDGLSINALDGRIIGTAQKGTADKPPYEIVVTVSDKIDRRDGIGIRFLLRVKVAEPQNTSESNFTINQTLEKTHWTNRQWEHMLALGDSGSTGGFVSKRISVEAGNSRQNLWIDVSSPERVIYMRMNGGLNNPSQTLDTRYVAQFNDTEILPDWLEFSPYGVGRIACSPDRHFVELTITAQTPGAPDVDYQIRVDTFTGAVHTGHQHLLSPVEQQLRQAANG